MIKKLLAKNFPRFHKKIIWETMVHNEIQFKGKKENDKRITNLNWMANAEKSYSLVRTFLLERKIDQAKKVYFNYCVMAPNEGMSEEIRIEGVAYSHLFEAHNAILSLRESHRNSTPVSAQELVHKLNEVFLGIFGLATGNNASIAEISSFENRDSLVIMYGLASIHTPEISTLRRIWCENILFHLLDLLKMYE